MFKKFFDRLFKDKEINNQKLNGQFFKNLKSLENILGFSINKPSYYLKALTHRSFLELFPELEKSNERLEFLGDSVLNMLVAKYMFHNYSEEGEGFLTKARSALVNRYRLFEAAEKLHLKDYILYNQKYLGDSEDGLHTILADSIEALIGAIYLDKGLKESERFVLKWLVLPYEEDESYLIDTNYKGQLLEYAHAKKLGTPKYSILKIEGPEHKKEFTVEVYIVNQMLGVGKGKSKKDAEQDASRIAIDKLKNN